MSKSSTEQPDRGTAEPMNMLVRPLGIGRFSAIMAATVLAFAAGTLALPVDPYTRFQSLDNTIFSRASWIYDRIHHDEAPIDIVVLGASREGAGVYPTLLEPALALRGIDARVVNFALASSGFDIREVIAHELFAEKRPRLLIFGVIETFPRDGHEAFGDIARVAEIAQAPWIVNRTLPRNLLRLPVRQIDLALATLMPEAFGRRRDFTPEAYAGSTIDPRSIMGFADKLDMLGTPEHAETLAAQAERRRRIVTLPILPESLAWIEFGVSRTYVERIVAMAQAHGTEVAFLFMPFYTGPEAPLEEAWLEKFGPVWKANFMRNSPRNYEDSAHSAASPEVKAMLTEWLADNIAAKLNAE